MIRRRRGPRYQSPVREVDTGLARSFRPNDIWGYEIEVLRQTEKAIALNNDVADAAIYHFQSVPEITNALKMAVYKDLIPRFEKRAPAGMVRLLVDATVRWELTARREMAAARTAAARLKAEQALARAARTASAA